MSLSLLPNSSISIPAISGGSSFTLSATQSVNIKSVTTTVANTQSSFVVGSDGHRGISFSGDVYMLPGTSVNFSSTARGAGSFTALSNSSVTVTVGGSGIGQIQTLVMLTYASGTAAGGDPYITSKDGHSSFTVFCPSGNTAVYNFMTFNIDPTGPF